MTIQKIKKQFQSTQNISVALGLKYGTVLVREQVR